MAASSPTRRRASAETIAAWAFLLAYFVVVLAFIGLLGFALWHLPDAHGHYVPPPGGGPPNEH